MKKINQACRITSFSGLLLLVSQIGMAELLPEELATGDTEAQVSSRTLVEADTVSTKDEPNNLTIVITPKWWPMDSNELPMTIHTLSDRKLDASGVNDTIDLQYQIPGFVFKTNTVLGQPYLRGVGSDIISAGSEASVSLFVDGVYQPRASVAIQDYFDIERVEVLKGPQGVHLGRNVVGGAISTITKDPDPFFDANVDVLYGSYDRRQFRGMVNMPIGDTDWAVRLAGSIIKRDGFAENIVLNKKTDDKDSQAWRGKIRYAPSKDFNLLFSTEHSRTDDTRTLGQQPDPGVGVNGGLLLGGTVPGNPRKVSHNVDQSSRVETDRYSMKLFMALNNVDFISTTAYQESFGELALEMDNTEVDFSSNFPWESSEAFSQEFRLASTKNGAFGWTAGAFLLHEDATLFLDVRLPLASVRNRVSGSVDTKAFGLFGEVSYDISPGWEGTAGIRYSYDHRKLKLWQIIEDPFAVTGPPGTTQVNQNDSDSWDAMTPEMMISYNFNDDTRIYAKASRGFKSGGFNTSTVQPSFDPEFLWSYELGFKSFLPGMRINGALFYYDYKDIQLIALDPTAPVGTFPSVINAAKATVKGADLEIWTQPIPQLDLSLGMTLLDAEFDEFISVDPNNPATNPDRSGGTLPQAPDISLNLNASYTWPVKNYGELKLSGEYRYQSSIYFNPFNDFAVKQDGYGLLSSQLTFESRKDHWYVELFGNNLTDELYAETILRQDPLIGTLRFWGAPRTFGLRVGYRL